MNDVGPGVEPKLRGLHVAAFAVMVACISPTASAAPYVPDRQALFEFCATMPEYVMLKPYGEATRAGTWRFSADRRAGAAPVLDAWNETGDDSLKRLAFVLATARRESGGTFHSVKEASVGPNGCSSDACIEKAVAGVLQKRMTQANGRRALKGQKLLTEPRPNYAKPAKNGKRYYGRGYIQVTNRSYQIAEDHLHIGLMDNPDLALEPKTAAKILVRATLEGWFGSGRPLSYYLNDQKTDWKAARDTTNPGTPNAAITAGYARDFAACLSGRNP